MKTWNFYCAAAPLSASEWLVWQNTFFVSSTLWPISSQCSVYVETRWLVCKLNVLSKVSSLTSTLALSLVKMENIHFSNRSHVGHLTKRSFLGPSYTKSGPWLVWCQYIFYRLRYVFYLSCDPTKSLHWDVHGWELIAACHHSVVTIDILITRGKMLHQKRGTYNYVLLLKNWVDWTITRREKNVTTSKMYILGRSAQKLKKDIFFLLWLSSMTLFLK